MCGFVGLIQKNGNKLNPDVLKRMAHTISHRGPDDEGSFSDDSVGFYHKRLSIIDLEHGQQPMEIEDHVLVFNGEIYNYIELREELIQKGHRFKTNSDTEVLLRMYLEYRIDFINRLNGMFAFLIYDKQRKQLIAARDHFGIKPLYFHKGRDFIAFASEIKALLANEKIEAHVNESSLHEYLTFQFILSNETLFDKIEKIPPGHYLLIDAVTMNLQVVKYWFPNFSIDQFHTEAYFLKELRKLLEDTVKIQLRSDVPLGTYLSGGIDSSMVTSLAAKMLKDPVHTFSGGFKEGPEFDETPYAQELASAINAKSSLIFPSAQDFIDNMPDLIYYLDEPVAGPGLFPQYMVSKLVSDHVKVVLGGQGGDEIFGGYARYVIAYLEQALKGAMLETTEEGEHIVSLETIIPNLPYIKRYLPMMKKFWGSGAFEAMDHRYFNLIDRMSGNINVFTDEFVRYYKKDHIFHKFQLLFNDPNTLSYYNKMTHFDMFGSLPALLQVEDRVSMAVSIESRVPLLDRRIVDLVVQMPPAMKFKGGEMKYILKKTAGDVLPKSILNRKDKMGFPVPLHLWAKNEARDFIRDTLLSPSSLQRGIFKRESLEKLVDGEAAYGRQLWGALSLELWFKQFID